MLALKSITLENFMGISHAELDLSHEVTIFSGKNGNGKSTVVIAIALALTDYKPSDTMKELIKKRQKSASIKLEAKILNDPISFDVEINQKGTNQKIIVFKGKTYKNSECSQLISELGLDYFGDIIFSLQGKNDISEMTPTKLAEYLQRLLQFDFSDKIEIIDEKIKDRETVLIKNEAEINFSEKAIIDRTKELKEEVPLPITKRQFQFFEIQKKELVEKIKKEQETLVQQGELKDNQIKLESQIFDCNKNIDIWNKKIEDETKRIEKYNDFESKFITENQILENLKTKKENVEIQRIKEDEGFKLEKEGLLKEYEQLQINLKELESGYQEKLVPLESSKSEALKIYSALENDHKHNSDHIKLIATGKCPTCSHEFTSGDEEKYKAISLDLEEKMSQRQKEYQDWDVAIKELLKEQQEKKNAVSEQIKKVNTVINNFDSLNKNIFDDQIKSIDKEIIVHEQTIKSIEAGKKEYGEKEIIDIAALEETISKEAARYEKLVDDIQKLKELLKDYDPQSLTNAQNELNKIQSQIDAYNESVKVNNEIITLNEKAREVIEKAKSEIEKIKNNMIDINNTLATYKEAKIVLSKTLPNYMIVKTCTKIEQEINDFMLCCFPDFYVKLFFNKKGVEFYFTEEKGYCEKEKEMDKDSLINIKLASGFQKALLSTAFKIALCRAYQLSLLILDESDASSNDENSENMFDTILNSGFFEQTIIITHKKLIRDLILSKVSDYKMYQAKNFKFSESEDD